MVKFSPGTKQRIASLTNFTRFVFHWGFIPVVLYLGFQKGADEGMPSLSILSLLWQ